jgi:translation initiation factor IF-2
MSKVRINDLARELEVKSRPILDALEAIGVTGKTHSSSIEADQAERVREYFKNGGRSSSVSRSTPNRSSTSPRSPSPATPLKPSSSANRQKLQPKPPHRVPRPLSHRQPLSLPPLLQRQRSSPPRPHLLHRRFKEHRSLAALFRSRARRLISLSPPLRLPSQASRPSAPSSLVRR